MSERSIIDYLEHVKIQQYKSDVGFKTLVESVDDNMYIIPKFQRRYRWSRERATELIYSLIKGFPIPPIYTYRNKENQLEILDGQQRVMSLFFYYMGKFMDIHHSSSFNFYDLNVGDRKFSEALEQEYKLSDFHVELENEKEHSINIDYMKLPKAIKRRVDYTTITVVEIKIDEGQNKEDVLRKIFANLNRGGEPLSNQEQRNGIYACEFYDMIQEFNQKNEKWRKMWGRENSKSKDVEMLLRFCSLKKYVDVDKSGFSIRDYNSSYASLLDKFSSEAMNYGENEIQDYKNSLEQFVALFALDFTFGNKVALLESIFIVCEKKKLNVKITKDICNQILASKKFTENARQGTVAPKTMRERWNVVYEILSRNCISDSSTD